jgi:hypothetical protein
VQISPLSVSSVGTTAVGVEQGVLSCGRPLDVLNPEQIAHCAIDDLDMNTLKQHVIVIT